MVSVFINIQLIINNGLAKGFPDQINEAFAKMYRYDLYVLLLVRIAQTVELLANNVCLVLIKTLRVRIS